MSLEELVAVYIKIRSAIEDKEDAHKAEVAVLKDQFDVIAGKLLEICNEQNADSIKTPAGTLTRRISSRYWTSDWGAMYDFIKEHGALYLLEQRLHNGNVKQFLEDNPDLVPAGLQSDRKYAVQVRKPTAK